MKRSAHPEGRRHREAVSESNVIEEEQLVDSGTGLQPVRTARYTWGTDVSGTLQGAGGVGGLLRADEVVGTAAATTHYYWYDGNGNATGLMRANGTIDATYRYTAFGGKAAEAYTVGTFGERNRYRFSTKYLDSEVETVEGTYYYGYRHYAVAMGRWVSRDPIGERGGVNLLVMLSNGCVTRIDVLGNIEYPPTSPGGGRLRPGTGNGKPPTDCVEHACGQPEDKTNKEPNDCKTPCPEGKRKIREYFPQDGGDHHDPATQPSDHVIGPDPNSNPANPDKWSHQMGRGGPIYDDVENPDADAGVYYCARHPENCRDTDNDGRPNVPPIKVVCRCVCPKDAN